MELGKVREEKAVDSLIQLLKEGSYRKAKIKLGQIKGDPAEFMKLFNFLTENTRLQETRISIETVKAKVSCNSCDWKGDPEILHDHVRCPRCRSDVDVLKGNEFEVHL